MEGDVPNLYGVSCRGAIVLAKGSPVGEAWDMVGELLAPCMGANQAGRDAATLVYGLRLLGMCCASKLTKSIYRRPDIQTFSLAWRELAPEINAALSSLGSSQELPQDILALLGADENWFSASWYWADWSGEDTSRS